MTAANTHPVMTPNKIPNRATMPRPATMNTMIAPNVTVATMGCVAKFFVADADKLNPISATIAPVTAGGITVSMIPFPRRFTTNPTAMSARPAATTPPSCAPNPRLFDANNGAINANDDPKYDGSWFRVITKNTIVPTPENNNVVFTGNPVKVGTSSVAPNMAITCCIPMPIVRPHDSRSSGATTAPG